MRFGQSFCLCLFIISSLIGYGLYLLLVLLYYGFAVGAGLNEVVTGFFFVKQQSCVFLCLFVFFTATVQ